MENRKYIIIPTSELFSIDFSEFMEESEDTLHYSLNKQKTILKWVGDKPKCLISNLHLNKQIYTHKEISSIVNTLDWKEMSFDEKETFEKD